MTESVCPALADLFSSSPAPEVTEHVTECLRCQTLLALRDERLPKESEDGTMAAETGSITAAPGSVALITSRDSDEQLAALVVRETDEAVTIIPLSEETAFAAEWDVLLPRSVLGYDAIAEVWNRGRVLHEQVAEVISVVPEDLFVDILALLRAAATRSERPSLQVGPAIVSRVDPRRSFQDNETERSHAFWEEALTFAGVASLGELVATRRDDLGLDSSELAVLNDEPGWLERLEGDAIDPTLVPRTALVSLMRQLNVSASRRLGQIAFATIAAARGGSGQGGYALARQGHRSKAGQQNAEEYVTAFLNDLGRDG